MIDNKCEKIANKRADIKNNPQDYGISDNFADIASVVFGWGAEFALSLSKYEPYSEDDCLQSFKLHLELLNHNLNNQVIWLRDQYTEKFISDLKLLKESNK